MSSTNSTVSHQWFSRPADERFLSLTSMREAKAAVRLSAHTVTTSSSALELAPLDEDRNALILKSPDGYTSPTNWAFSQLCQRAAAPAPYLRSLPPALAADCVNVGLLRDASPISLYSHSHDPYLPIPQAAAVTSASYGRIYDLDVIDALIDRFGDGVTGDFTVPGEFGKAVEVDQHNTTLFASDRDMFVFLADETRRVTIPNRRDGKAGSLARGFYVSNSEVGNASLVVGLVLFDYACCNRILWGVEQFKEVRLRHSVTAPDRFLSEVQPQLIGFADSSADPIQSALAAAQAAKISDVDKFLANRKFSGVQTSAIKLAHLVDEGRPIETVWDAVTGITAYARELEYQDARIDLERRAGDLLTLAAR